MEKCQVPDNMEGISHVDNNTMTSTTRDEEQFMDITTMVAFWERQEDEEPTPVQERVLVRRRRSTRLEGLVGMLGLEQERVIEKRNYCLHFISNLLIVNQDY